jgi:hypothetical protein
MNIQAVHGHVTVHMRLTTGVLEGRARLLNEVIAGSKSAAGMKISKRFGVK